MEWSWRTAMILIGFVVMIAILVDGFRRMRRARAEALKLDVSDDFKFPEDGYNPELPGEVRIVGSGVTTCDTETKTFDTEAPDAELSGVKTPDLESSDIETSDVEALDVETSKAKTTEVETSDDIDHIPSFNALDGESDQPDSPLIPKAQPVNLDEQVPVLLDVEELGEETDVVSSSESVDLESAHSDAVHTGASSDNSFVPSVEETPVEASAAAMTTDLEDPAHIEDPHLELEAEPEEVAAALANADTLTQPVNFAGADAEVLAERPQAEVVLVVHTIARAEQGFKGSELIYLFNSCDLRFGEKNIFHRFEQADGNGRIQFSVSQSHEPGIFEPEKMADQTFRGLSFFMSLPGAKKPLEAYEAVYEMAMVVARNLKAEVLDESLSALTPQTVESNREDIMTYERQQHLLLKKQSGR